ncbi:MAG: response regulator [Planctomycetota bacterium]|nr:response regulator [Planctomycetota bacterium]
MDTGPVNDTIRLSQHELDAILAEMNRSSGGKGASKRASRRWTLQSQKGVLTLVDGNGNKVHHQVTPRNISKTGLSVLFGGFLHPGAKCLVALRAVNGSARVLSGSVVQCRHVRGRLHELGIALSEPANPRDFFIKAGDEYLFNCERVDISLLKGTILLIDDSVPVQRLMAHYLKGSALELQTEECGADGLEAFGREPDMVLVDYNLPDMTGLDFVTKVRAMGHRQPVILITAENDKELRMAAIAAGANELLFKPITPELLHRAVAEFLSPEARERAAGDAELRLPANEAGAYAAQLGKLAGAMTAALENAQGDKVRAGLREIQGTAGSYGHGALAEKARELTRMLDGGAALERIAPELRALIRACEKIQSSAAAA